jgi:hypothetical protein
MDTNRIVTYSLLAHINDNEKGIKDLSDIFLPLVKRVLFQLSNNGLTKGLLTELKTQVDKTYSFDIPFPFLRRLVTKIAVEANKDITNDFQFFKDGSFIMSKFIFTEYEEIILKQQAEVDSLANTYEQYLLANNIKPQSHSSVFDFLDQNRIALSSFFSVGKSATKANGFFIQAKFINEIRKEPTLFQVLRKIYFGSIITSYLELDFGEIKESQCEYLLDSSFIIHLLDLSSPESTHTCNKIIEICKRLKYRVSVLDYTIEETEGVLKRIAESLGTTYLIKQLDENSIYNACTRRSLGKTDIIRIAANLGNSLRDDFGIYVIPNTTSYRNKAKYSSEYEQLKNRTNNPDGALHDTTAIVYVQEKRKKRCRNFYEANCWFITDSKQDLKLTRKNDGTLSEIIRPEELVNILWLTNPHVKGNEITTVGLTRLIASAISDSLPNPRALKEFDNNLQKYSQGKIEPTDCILVGHMIAEKTLTNLEALNDLAKESPSRFIEELEKLIKHDKVQEEQNQAKGRALILKLKANYETKLREKEILITSQYQQEIARLQEIHGKEKEEARQKELSTLKQALDQVKSTNDAMALTKKSLDGLASSDVKRLLVSLFVTFVIVIALEAILTISYGWNVMEPWTYFIGLVPIAASYLYFAITLKEGSPKAIVQLILHSKQMKRYSEAAFDLEFYNSLELKIASLHQKIENFGDK